MCDQKLQLEIALIQGIDNVLKPIITLIDIAKIRAGNVVYNMYYLCLAICASEGDLDVLVEAGDLAIIGIIPRSVDVDRFHQIVRQQDEGACQGG